MNFIASNVGSTRRWFEADITEIRRRFFMINASFCLFFAWRSAQNRSHTSNEFSHAIGLGDVVVSTDFQGHDRVDFFALRGHHDDGHVRGVSNRSTDV